MAQVLKLNSADPTIHVKAYGGIQITGVERAEITCDIDSHDLVTMVEEGDHVYVTVNSSCNIAIPIGAVLQIEKGMGSVEVRNMANKIEIEKVLGSLILSDVSEVGVGKVGGNFAVQNAAGPVQVEKVGGNLIVDNVESFSCEKIGGNCTVKNVAGEFALYKAGGNAKAQDIRGLLRIERLGGSFTGKNVVLASDLRVGGNISVMGFALGGDDIGLKAGGDIFLEISEAFGGGIFNIQSGSEDIRIAVDGDDLKIDGRSYKYQVGEEALSIDTFAGGSVSLKSISDPDAEIVGDLSNHFVYEESPFSEMIRERIESATRLAEAKAKSTEIRLDQILDQVEKRRGFKIRTDVEGGEAGKQPDVPAEPVRPVRQPAGKKGASDEERLMILKMLQDKKITVDEAETLFKALEN